MKIKLLLFVLTVSLYSTFTFAQTNYSQGDITISEQMSPYHDANNCYSMSDLMYQVNISNSQLGDTFKINVPGIWGYNVATAINQTGDSFWSFYIYNEVPQFFYDEYLNNIPGNAFFYWGERKAILTHYNGGQSVVDTIYNIIPMSGLYVDNPCTYRAVSGKVYFDENADCAFDASDTPLNGVNISAISNIETRYGSSNSSGNYNFNIQESFMTSYQVKLPDMYQFIFQSSACSPVYYNETVLPQANLDFALQCAEIDLYSRANGPGRALPDSAFNINASVGNIGCTPTSGVLKLKLDPRVVYNASGSYNLPVSVIPAADGDTLVWNYTNLSSLSNGAYWNAFISRIKVTPLTTTTIGDTLHFYYLTGIPTNDVNVNNNQGAFNVAIVAAYDPNFKEVEPVGVTDKGYVVSSTSDLTYTVHFQNTGTASATNIYVIDTLDSNVDPSSLHIELTSHTLTPEWLAPNVVKFKFNNISLPHADVNEPGSHGLFTYSVRLNSDLPLGTEINNRAFIYFDFNPPITTNYATTTLAEKPIVTTNSISGLNVVSLDLNGTLVSEEGAPILERGFCLSREPMPDVNDTVIQNVDISTDYFNTINNLEEETVYYVRAYAINAMGTSYGDEINFTTGSSVGLEELVHQITVYPNPASQILNIQSTLLLEEYTIYGMDGKLIQSNRLNKNDTNINIASLNTGNYFIEICTYNGFKKRLLFSKK